MTRTSHYVERLRAALETGDATEHTHRAALQEFIESFDPDVVATNEPKRVAAGAPDYSVGRRRGHGLLLIGKIEAKDVGADLDAIHSDSERPKPRTREGEQLRRYREAFDNLLLSDYIQFRWYRRSESRLEASLGASTGNKITVNPNGAADVEALIKDFLAAVPHKVRTARMLAERMARLTDLMQEIVLASIKAGEVSKETQGLQDAFKQVLVADLTDETFADMFCQTIAYGLFAARVRHDAAGGPFLRSSAATEIPRTNPFLRRLFSIITGPDLDDEPYSGLVEDLAQLLDDTDMTRVLRDFGSLERRDPIVHFYETFLGEYDPKLRDIRGVYYTPLPVVSYITRSVDQLLTQRFGVVDGLADTSTVDNGDHRVLVLDPATGTGTFLYEVIDLVRQRIRESGMAGAWPSYVREHLLPRLFGFEIMMAPYAVAHLKIGLQLAGQDLREEDRTAWAYDFEHDDRVGIYLTNALDPGETRTSVLLGEFISDEANAAAHVKTDRPIMVVLGNPPYQGQSVNASDKILIGKRGRKERVRTFIGELLRDYYTVDGAPLGEQNPKWLQDDYVKFIRFGQWRIDKTGRGLLGFVTNHTYLDAPTFRGMREKLLRSFDDIYIVDLHGSLRRREKNPNGGVDENVFDQIQQGVSIVVFVKSSDDTDLARVHFHERWGEREDKYQWLTDNTTASTEWESFTPGPPFYGFHPQDSDVKAEWDSGLSLTSIFPTYSTGVVTHRDELVVDTSATRLRNRIRDFLDSSKSDEAIRAKYFGEKAGRTTARGEYYQPGDNRDWKMASKRAALMADADRDGAFTWIHFRPFDKRAIFYHRHAIDGMKYDVMKHMLAGPNVGLVSARSNKSQTQDQFLATSLMTEVKTGEATTGSVLFPLWLYLPKLADEDEGHTLIPIDEVNAGKVPNLGEACRDTLQSRLGLTLVNNDFGDLTATVGVHDVFNYVYGIVHSRAYRLRYAEFLRSDYAHIPFTGDLDTFRQVCQLGKRLVRLHLLDDSNLNVGNPSFPVVGTGEVAPGFPKWRAAGEAASDGLPTAEEDRLYINRDGSSDGASGQYFEPVAQEVWEFTVGGHQVLDKWLKARRGDRLGFDAVRRFARIVNALRQTLDVQADIEELLPLWPLA